MTKRVNTLKVILIFMLFLCNVAAGQENKHLKLELKNISNEIDNFESVLNIKNTILNKTLPIQNGDIIASIGAGYGWKEAIMDSLTQGVHYFLQDIVDEKKTEKRFEANKKKYGSKGKQNTFSFVKGTILKTNLPNNHFDLIYISNAFHEFEEPDSMILDIKAKLKTNGQLAIVEYFSNQGNDFVYDGCKKHGYTFEAISKLMNKSICSPSLNVYSL